MFRTRRRQGARHPPCKLSQVLTLFFNLQMLALLFFFQPRAVRVTGLGTFHLQKWLSFENGEVLTFQRPVFLLSRTLAQIRGLQHASVPVPGKKSKEILCFPVRPCIWCLCWLLFRSNDGHIRGLQKALRATSVG